MPEKKKLLYLRLTSSNFGGIERQIADLADAAAAHGAVEPALLTTDAGSQLAREFTAKGRAVHAVAMGRLGFAGAAARLERSLDFGTVAAVESHMFRESFYGRSIKRRFPRVAHVFRAHTYVDCSYIPEWRKRSYHWADRLTQRWVDGWAANGEYLKREIIERSGVDAGKVVSILNGVAATGVSAANLDGAPPSREAAMVANLIEHKGHDVLVEALALLKARGVALTVRLLGNAEADPALTARIKTLARERGVLDRLDFRGFADVAEGLRGVSVLLLPSDSEGLPLAVLEAMSRGMLVVASSVGAVPECVTDGRDGFLHPPRDPAALAAILERLYAAPAGAWAPVARAARRSWEERFTRERMTAELGRLYRERLGLEVYG